MVGWLVGMYVCILVGRLEYVGWYMLVGWLNG